MYIVSIALTTFLLSLIIFYTKFIAFVYLIIFIVANYESNQIINRKIYYIRERPTNYAISPKRLYRVPEDVKIGTILYTAYWNLVFNITYFKILYGPFYILKTLNLKIILRRIFFMYFGISILTIKLVMHVFKMHKKNTIGGYLFTIFHNSYDNRTIVRINNEWKINNGWKNFANIAKNENDCTNLDCVMNNFIGSERDLGLESDNLINYYAGPVEIKICGFSETIVLSTSETWKYLLPDCIKTAINLWKIEEKNIQKEETKITIKYNFENIKLYIEYAIIFL